MTSTHTPTRDGADGEGTRMPADQAPPPRESRRRPPRADRVTFRLAVDLDGVTPRVWRALDVASDTRLDVLHDVLQVALGWTDSHLHEFAVGESWYDPDIERFAMAGDVDMGFEDEEPDVPEAVVRLDELLADVGDVLLYSYDFGDGWLHTVRLDAVEPLLGPAAPARCTAGGGRCPPEDCGGVHGYEELLAAAANLSTLDPDERDELVQRLEWLFPGVAPRDVAAAARAFDPVPVNVELARPPLPRPLIELLDRAHGPERQVLTDLLERAGLDRPVLIDAGAAAQMVEPFAWLVGYVGAAGLPLTAAGYLKPADVEAVAAELAIEDEWIGSYNRESQTLPVLWLRQCAQKLGLLRVARGRVRATRVGIALRGDPIGLWWHLAARLPVVGRPYDRDAGLAFLLAVAAEADAEDQAAVIRSLGWAHGDGSPVTAASLRGDSGLTRRVLVSMGAFDRVGRYGWTDRANRNGVAFARAAVRSWP